MFGWEFPPHISGGLGTACAGLTHALENEQVDVLFAIPKLQGGETGARITFINASTIPIQQNPQTALRPPSGFDEPKNQFQKRDLSSKRVQRTVLEIPSYLAPYSTSTLPSFALEHWNYSFAEAHDRTIPASLRKLTSSSPDGHNANTAKTSVKKNYSFSGTYSNLLEEVDRYARLASRSHVGIRSTSSMLMTG